MNKVIKKLGKNGNIVLPDLKLITNDIIYIHSQHTMVLL